MAFHYKSIYLSLSNSEKLNINMVLHHSNDSLAESYPARLRIITPNYVIFQDNIDTISTNYTIMHNTTLGVKVEYDPTGNDTHHSYVDFLFEVRNSIVEKNLAIGAP